MNYLNDSIGVMYKKLVPSAIGSMLTATVASLIDTVILSYFLGPTMLSSVSICMPIYMIVNALALLIVSGGVTICASYVGKGDREESNRFFTLSFVCVVIVGIILTIVGSLFTKELITLLGANEAIITPTLEYARVLMFFMLPLMLYCFMLFFVRFDSDPGLALTATGTCAIINLILDVLFVGPLKLGAGGAALATCLAYTVATLVGFIHFFKKKNTLHLVRKSLTLRRTARLLKTGAPLSLSQFGMAVTTSVFNTQIIRVGGELYLTAYAIVTQLSMSALAFYEGVAQASQPILAANYGAGENKRVREALKIGIILELLFTGICALLFVAGTDLITALFSVTEGELLDVCEMAIRLFALAIPFAGMNMLGTYFFQAKEKVLHATVISVCGGMVLLIISLITLTSIFGPDGIWWSWLASHGICFIYTVLTVRRELVREKRKALNIEVSADAVSDNNTDNSQISDGAEESDKSE